jgi:hypothetical protein
MRIHLLQLGALALALSACGGASRAPTTPNAQADDEEIVAERREVVGDSCVAQYAGAADITVIIVEVPQVGFVGVPVVGDGWSIDCRERGRQLLVATNEPAGRYATVVVDPGATQIPDLSRYATEHGEAMAQHMGENGLSDIRLSEPMLVGQNAYVLAIGGTTQGVRFGQINAFALLPTSIGLLRYHISEISDDGQALNDHVQGLVAMAVGFGLLPEDDPEPRVE